MHPGITPPDGTHLHPGITPLAARSRLAARATDAKICLWQIKHRRVQTAAVGLCRGVYVFIARVVALSFLRIMLRHVLTAAVDLCRGVYVFVGRVKPVLRHTLSCGLCSGMCRQPQWVYVGVFMYSLAGWSRFYGQKYVI